MSIRFSRFNRRSQFISLLIATAVLILIASGCQGQGGAGKGASRELDSPAVLEANDTLFIAEAAQTRSEAIAAAAPRMRVTLTFDDGPDPKTTPQILDILKHHRVRAAFFVIGQRADANPDIVARVASEGHLVLNHTYTHPLNPDMTHLSDEQIRDELNRTDAAIERITRVHPAYFRAPGGALDDRVKSLAGRPVIQWSIEGGDWNLTDSNAVFNNIYPKLANETIVLMHDNHEVTVTALSMLLDAIPADRFDILRLDDYLTAVKP